MVKGSGERNKETEGERRSEDSLRNEECEMKSDYGIDE
jgi:hypothetical protein